MATMTKEYTIKVRALDMKAKVLKQLPRLSTMTRDEADALEPICWFQTSVIERGRLGRSLLVELKGETYVITDPQYFMSCYERSPRSVMWNDHEVPFAVVL